jgi:hypothetical protein
MNIQTIYCALDIRHANRTFSVPHYTIVFGLSVLNLRTFSTQSHKSHIHENVVLYKMCFDFSTTFTWDIDHCEKNSEQYYIFTSEISVKNSWFLKDFKDIWIFAMDCPTILKYSIFMWDPSWYHADKQTDGRTDMANIIFAFRDFSNAYKKCLHFN